MRLGRLSRAGIVVSLLYAILVSWIAYESRPRLEYIQAYWIVEAAKTIAQEMSKRDGTQVRPEQVREHLLDKNYAENIAWLEKVADRPTEKQQFLSAAVKQVNDRNQALVADFPAQERMHVLYALAWWLAGSAFLFACGWIFRLVIQWLLGMMRKQG